MSRLPCCPQCGSEPEIASLVNCYSTLWAIHCVDVRCTYPSVRGTTKQEAIDELVSRNLRFVVSVAKQYSTVQNHLEDLVNEGNIGLIMAAQKFKPEMGFRFISYAVWWIRKVIMEHLCNHGRMVRLPANRINSLSKLDKKINALEQKLGREVSIQEIIAEYGSELGLDGKDKSEYKKVSDEYEFLDFLNSYNMDSLDRDLSGEDGNGTTLGDTISSDSGFQPTDQGMVDTDLKNQLNSLLDTLKPRDRKVMVWLFGLEGQHPRTLKDVADEIGVTREMVRQIREKSLAKLKDKLSFSELMD